MSELKKNWLEWSVFVAGALLVVGVIGYLAYDAATAGNDPPSIEVQLGAPEQRLRNFAVPVTVVNHGDQTAEGVQIEVVLEEGGAESERGEFAVAFLPRHSSREGWVAFQRDPRNGTLRARVLGYEKP